MLFDPELEAENILIYLNSLREEIPNERFIVRQLISFYKDKGQVEQAISELDNLGDMLLEAGDKGAAVEVIQEIITMNPPNIEAYQKLLKQLQV